jgi:hypothetical protein
VAQCYGVDTGFTAQSRTVPGMASQRGLAKQRRDMIPRRCQSAGVVGIRFWPGRPRRVRAFNALVGGWVRGLRAREGLKRGGDSPKGATSPRARLSAWWTAEIAWPVSFFPAPDHDHVGSRFVSSFSFIIFRKRGFSLVIRGPLWPSPTSVDFLRKQ